MSLIQSVVAVEIFALGAGGDRGCFWGLCYYPIYKNLYLTPAPPPQRQKQQQLNTYVLCETCIELYNRALYYYILFHFETEGQNTAITILLHQKQYPLPLSPHKPVPPNLFHTYFLQHNETTSPPPCRWGLSRIFYCIFCDSYCVYTSTKKEGKKNARLHGGFLFQNVKSKLGQKKCYFCFCLFPGKKSLCLYNIQEQRPTPHHPPSCVIAQKQNDKISRHAHHSQLYLVYL